MNRAIAAVAANAHPDIPTVGDGQYLFSALAGALADVIAADPQSQVAIDQFEFSRRRMRIHVVARARQQKQDAWGECIATDVNVAERLARLQQTVVNIAIEESFEPTFPS